MDTSLRKLFFKDFPYRRQALTWLGWNICKSILILMLVLSLSSCGDKAKSQEPYNNVNVRDNPQLTNQISEVSPPPVIQELRRSLEAYRPQVKILAPHNHETLQDDTVSVQFEVKDLPIFESQFKLGSHLDVILDNQPYTAVYDVNQPLILPNLSAGTHTVRVFASRPWNESFKNEGAYAQVTFNVFTQSDENNPETSQPLLTYNSPQGDFGAEPILLDFYLTNAPLQIGGRDISQDEIGDWRIRCTINGESFVLDRWESIYLKGFKPGKNWVKLDFLDGQGQLVKNVFNTTIRSITYKPKGQDTLAKIVRGEVTAEEVRSIVDPNYITKEPTVEPKPTPTVTPTIEPTVKPTVEPTPETQLQEEKPVIPETPQPTPDVTQPEESKQPPLQQPKSKSKKDGFYKRRTIKAPAPQPTIEPTPPSVTPDLPEITPETNLESPALQPEVTPTPETTNLPEPEKASPRKYFQRPPAVPQPNQPEESKFGKYFQRRTPTPTVSPIPDLNQPAIDESPTSGEKTPIPSAIPPDLNQPAIDESPTSGEKTPIPSAIPPDLNQPAIDESPTSGEKTPIPSPIPPDLNQPAIDESPTSVEKTPIPSSIPEILNKPVIEQSLQDLQESSEESKVLSQ